MSGAAHPELARWVAAAAIAATVWAAAACSDQDTVDVVPPPWPTETVTPDGPIGVPRLPDLGSVFSFPAVPTSAPPTAP